MEWLQKLLFGIYLWFGLTCANIPMPMCPKGKESGSRADCVCNSQVYVDYFSNSLHIGPSMKDKYLEVIKARTNAFFCHEFYQLPPYLEIEIDSVPIPYSGSRRLRKKVHRFRNKRSSSAHRRVKRQVSLGYPSDEVFQTAIPKMPKKGRHMYSPLGSHLAMKCFAGQDDRDIGTQEDIVGESSKFEWKHLNGMEITGPLTNVDKTTGDLVFHRVRLADTSIYKCTVTTEDDAGAQAAASFISQLDVVSAPTFWLRFGMTYKTDRCRHKELLVIQKRVPEWVHSYVCHFCPVRNVSLTCINLGGHDGEDGKFVQLTMAISTVGLEDLLSSWDHNREHCSIECQKTIHAKLLGASVIGESLVKLFSLKVNVLSVDGPTTVYTPIPDSYDEDVADACPPGFFLTYTLCFPCAPGRFSPTGPAECYPCAKGFFQPNPGSSACFHCPEGHTTTKRGSLSQAECILDTAASWMDFFAENLFLTCLVAGLLLLFLILWILICCCWPKSCMGRCLRCVPCCGESEDGVDAGSSIEYKKIIQNTSTSELDSDASEVVHEKETERIFRSSGKRKGYRGVSDNDDGGGAYTTDADFSSPEKRIPIKQQVKGKKSVQQVAIESIEENNTLSKKRSTTNLPNPKRLDLDKYAIKQPIIPLPLEHRPRYCYTTICNKRKQQKEKEAAREKLPENQPDHASQEDREQPNNKANSPPHFRRPAQQPSPNPPPFPKEDGNQSDTSETSSGRKRAKKPHVHLGNILRYSKSFVNKLAEQRAKLKHAHRGDSSSKSSPSRKRLVASAKASLNKIKNNNSKMVKISESRNTFHPTTTADADKQPCNTCTSQVFKNKSKSKNRENKYEDTSSSRSKIKRSNNSDNNKNTKLKLKKSSWGSGTGQSPSNDRFKETMKKMQEKAVGSLRSISKKRKK